MRKLQVEAFLVVFLGWSGTTSVLAHSCGDCHTRTTSPDGDSQAPSKPDAGTCLPCHAELLKGDAARGRAAAYGHLKNDGLSYEAVPPGGTTRSLRLDCLTCHSAHPNGRTHQLRQPDAGLGAAAASPDIDDATRLCLSCHPEQARFGQAGSRSRHPIGIPAQTSARVRTAGLPLFDVKGTSDPSDDVIGCLTCHSAHVSPEANLLRWSPRGAREACGACHTGVYLPLELGPGRTDEPR